jgi:ArsR family metal-binding transcriptional regulator
MLLPVYEPRVFRPPCDYGSEVVNASAEIAGDISPVFPYLNAIIPGAQYHAAARSLRFRWDGHLVMLHHDKLAISGFEDGDAAIEGLARLQRLINETWERRAEIEPSHVERKRLTPTQIFQLLPRTNCRECGQPSCFVFASRVVVGEAGIAECTPLAQPQYAGQMAQLLRLLEDAVI